MVETSELSGDEVDDRPILGTLRMSLGCPLSKMSFSGCTLFAWSGSLLTYFEELDIGSRSRIVASIPVSSSITGEFFCSGANLTLFFGRTRWKREARSRLDFFVGARDGWDLGIFYRTGGLKKS